MAAIRSKDTKPELAVRRALRAANATGYRLHVRALPGKPDLAFTRWRVAIFVDGAFWHGHHDHFNDATATAYWREKIDRTRERDRLANAALGDLGWSVVRIWDFEVKESIEAVTQRILGQLQERGWVPPVTHEQQDL